MSNKFDEPTKGLAQSVTRRQALKKFSVGLACMALAFFGPVNPARAAGPTYTTIDFPGSLGTLAVDINDFGQIAGRYIDSAGVNHGYLLDNGIFTSITFPGASFTRAIGINRNGDIVGSYSTPSDKGPGEHGFLLRGGVFTSIDFPNAVATLTAGINSSGDIAGFYQDDKTRHGFVLHAGTFSTIDYPGASYTEAWKINDSGQVAGRYIGKDGNYHVYLLSNGNFTSFDYPGALQTSPQGYSHVGGLNNLGDITTDYASGAPSKYLSRQDDAGNVHGFILSAGVFTSFDFPGANTTLPFGINDNRQVVGVYADVNEAFHGFLRTP
jgi:uncharacterized membrane protein